MVFIDFVWVRKSCFKISYEFIRFHISSNVLFVDFVRFYVILNDFRWVVFLMISHDFKWVRWFCEDFKSLKLSENLKTNLTKSHEIIINNWNSYEIIWNHTKSTAIMKHLIKLCEINRNHKSWPVTRNHTKSKESIWNPRTCCEHMWNHLKYYEIMKLCEIIPIDILRHFEFNTKAYEIMQSYEIIAKT